MARPTTQQVQDRTVVQTIEDQHKYAMPDDRKLMVRADPQLNIVTPVDSSVTRLATALAQVKPEIMTYVTDRQTELYKTEIDQGQQAARVGDPIANATEHQQWGYDGAKAINDGTDWATDRLVNNYEQNFDKEKGDIEQFLAEEYQNSPAEGKSEIYRKNFYRIADAKAQAIRTQFGKDKLKILTDNTDNQVIELTLGDMIKADAEGTPWGAAELEARRNNAKTLYAQGKTYAELDELMYKAVHRRASELNKPELLDVFQEKHSDGTPGLYSKNWEKIEKDKLEIARASATAYEKLQKHYEKTHKDAADFLERQVSLTMLDMLEADDATKETMLDDLKLQLKAAQEAGLPVSVETFDKVRKYVVSGDKAEETKAQADAMVAMAGKNLSFREITRAKDRGDISLAGWKYLTSELKSEQRHREAQAKQNSKPVYEKTSYKAPLKEIKGMMGVPDFTLSGTPGEERSKQYAQLEVNFKRDVLSFIEEGMTEEKAISTAKDNYVNIVKANGWLSDAYTAAGSTIEESKLKLNNPVKYYSDKPASAYQKDVKLGTAPQLTATQFTTLKEVIKKKTLAEAEAKKKQPQGKTNKQQ